MDSSTRSQRSTEKKHPRNYLCAHFTLVNVLEKELYRNSDGKKSLFRKAVEFTTAYVVMSKDGLVTR